VAVQFNFHIAGFYRKNLSLAMDKKTRAIWVLLSISVKDVGLGNMEDVTMQQKMSTIIASVWEAMVLASGIMVLLYASWKIL
jgi:hypothetical protein